MVTVTKQKKNITCDSAGHYNSLPPTNKNTVAFAYHLKKVSMETYVYKCSCVHLKLTRLL